MLFFLLSVFCRAAAGNLAYRSWRVLSRCGELGWEEERAYLFCALVVTIIVVFVRCNVDNNSNTSVAVYRRATLGQESDGKPRYDGQRMNQDENMNNPATYFKRSRETARSEGGHRHPTSYHQSVSAVTQNLPAPTATDHKIRRLGGQRTSDN